MPNATLTRLNKERKALRSRIVSASKAYAAASAKMLAAMERSSKEELGAFLKKNPDAVFDIGGGAAAKLCSRAKAVAANIFSELKKDLKAAGQKGGKKAKTAVAKIESKALEYIKKILSF